MSTNKQREKSVKKAYKKLLKAEQTLREAAFQYSDLSSDLDDLGKGYLGLADKFARIFVRLDDQIQRSKSSRRNDFPF